MDSWSKYWTIWATKILLKFMRKSAKSNPRILIICSKLYLRPLSKTTSKSKWINPTITSESRNSISTKFLGWRNKSARLDRKITKYKDWPSGKLEIGISRPRNQRREATTQEWNKPSTTCLSKNHLANLYWNQIRNLQVWAAPPAKCWTNLQAMSSTNCPSTPTNKNRAELTCLNHKPIENQAHVPLALPAPVLQVPAPSETSQIKFNLSISCFPW